MRFHESIHPENRILFATDGIILAETAGDRLLCKYKTIIIDEAHERSIPIDFLLGYLRSVLICRVELKLIIASATMETGLFSRCFRNAPVITISGRRHPVEIRYEPVISLWQGRAMRSYVDGVIHAVRSIIESDEPGDILAFLPTVDDIHECSMGLRALMKGKACDVMNLYGRMSPDEQGVIFTHSSRRRIICATNIAETSVTVPNIRFVVDTGLARCVRFDTGAGITRMPVERISKASAEQRAGRCGRVRDGICIRLYTEAEYASMPRYTPPEIRRSNLAGVILRMARLGFGKPQQFPFVQHPSPVSLDAGFRQLRFLGALDSRGRLTKCGGAMAALPLDPAIARMLLHAQENGAFYELAIIASALSVGEMRADHANPSQWGQYDGKGRFFKGRPINRFSSDFMELVAMWRAMPRNKRNVISRKRLVEYCKIKGLSSQRVKEWINVHRQLVGICRRFGCVAHEMNASYETVQKSLLSALAGNVAELNENGTYATSRKGAILLSPGSRLFRTRHDWVLLHDITETKHPYARYAAVIRPHWIQDLFAKQCQTTYNEMQFNPEWGTVTCLRQVTFNGLYLVKNQRIDYGAVAPAEAHEIFIREALVRGMVSDEYDFLLKNRAVKEWVECAQRKLRTNSLYRGEQALADFYSEHLPGVYSIAQLKARIGRAKSDRFLHVRPEILLNGPLPEQINDYPDTVIVAGREAPLSYVFEPGADADGATAVIPWSLYKNVPSYFWEWLLPAFTKQRIAEIVRQIKDSLPSDELDRGVEEVINALLPGKGYFFDQALPVIRKILGLSQTVLEKLFDERGGRLFSKLSRHLWLRLRIVDETQAEIETIRPPFHTTLEHLSLGRRPDVWQEWCSPWECENILEWNNEKILQEVSIIPPGQLTPIYGITGFSREDDRVCKRVFFSKNAAYGAHRHGVRALLERSLNDKIAWEWRDFSKNYRLPYQLREQMENAGLNGCLELLFSKIVLDLDYELPTEPDAFGQLKKTALERIEGAGLKAIALISAFLPEYTACLRVLDKFKSERNSSPMKSEYASDLESLLKGYAKAFFHPLGRLNLADQLPRYLRGFPFRVRMASDKPISYAKCVEGFHKFQRAAGAIRKSQRANLPDIARLLDAFEWSIEEYTLATFTHGQIATLFPVSEQRLEKSMAGLLQTVAASKDF